MGLPLGRLLIHFLQRCVPQFHALPSDDEEASKSSSAKYSISDLCLGGRNVIHLPGVVDHEDYPPTAGGTISDRKEFFTYREEDDIPADEFQF